MDLNFGMWMCLGDRSLIFGKSRSKVKVENPQKYAFSGPILVTGAMCGTIRLVLLYTLHFALLLYTFTLHFELYTSIC